MCMKVMLWIVYCALLFEDFGYCQANDPEPDQDQPILNEGELIRTESFCGLLCIYGYEKLVGREVPLSELLKPEYHGSYSGSSLADLEAAATAVNLPAKVLKNLSLNFLESMRSGIILLIARNLLKPEDGHYVLLLDAVNSHFLVFDPARGIRWISGKKLLAEWTQVGILLGDSVVNYDSTCMYKLQHMFRTILPLAWISLFLILIHIFLRGLKQKRVAPRSLRRSCVEAILLLLWIIGFAVIFCHLSSNSLLLNIGSQI